MESKRASFFETLRNRLYLLRIKLARKAMQRSVKYKDGKSANVQGITSRQKKLDEIIGKAIKRSR